MNELLFLESARWLRRHTAVFVNTTFYIIGNLNPDFNIFQFLLNDSSNIIKHNLFTGCNENISKSFYLGKKILTIINNDKKIAGRYNS